MRIQEKTLLPKQHIVQEHQPGALYAWFDRHFRTFDQKAESRALKDLLIKLTTHFKTQLLTMLDDAFIERLAEFQLPVKKIQKKTASAGQKLIYVENNSGYFQITANADPELAGTLKVVWGDLRQFLKSYLEGRLQEIGHKEYEFMVEADKAKNITLLYRVNGVADESWKYVADLLTKWLAELRENLAYSLEPDHGVVRAEAPKKNILVLNGETFSYLDESAYLSLVEKTQDNPLRAFLISTSYDLLKDLKAGKKANDKDHTYFLEREKQLAQLEAISFKQKYKETPNTVAKPGKRLKI